MVVHPTIVTLQEFFKMGRLQELKDKVTVANLGIGDKDIWKCLVSEFIGTFFLVFIGCGSTLYVDPDGKDKPSLLAVALAFGITVATLIQSIGHISGCHINPAVTLAWLVSGKMHLLKSILYITTQIIGAIVGSYVLKVLTPEGAFGDLGVTLLNPKLSPLQGFGIEFLLTLTFVLIVFAVTDENRSDIKGSPALAIGLALSGLALFGGPYTSASLNPARSFAPAVITGIWTTHWIYWIGPAGGAVTAAALYMHLFRAPTPSELETIEKEKEKKYIEQGDGKENGVTLHV